MSGCIYLDYNATTPLSKDVLETMMPFFTEHFGNASSAHPYGKVCKEAVKKARKQVADLINAQLPEEEIVFSGGGTEGINFVIFVSPPLRSPLSLSHSHSHTHPHSHSHSHSRSHSIAKGVARDQKKKGLGNHIITSDFEHWAVSNSLAYLEREEGFEITRVPAGPVSTRFLSFGQPKPSLRTGTGTGTDTEDGARWTWKGRKGKG